MHSEALRQVKVKLLDLTFLSHNREQAEALLKLKKAISQLEQSLGGEKQLFFDFSETKSGM